MKRIIFLVGLILVIGTVFVYGQENANTQNTAQSQGATKTFAEPLEKRVEKAVAGMESYGEEVYREIESVDDDKEKTKTFLLKLKEYISNHVRDNSIRELLELEAQILKRGEGMDSIYGWFHAVVHGTVLKLAGYDPRVDIPITDKILEIIQDKSVDDYVRSKYVIDIGGRFNTFHNKGIEVDNAIKERIYPILVKIIDNTKNSSILRAETAGVLASIGGDSEKISKYLIKLLDEKDDLIKTRIIYICRLNYGMSEKLISILQNRSQYSKEIIETVRDRLVREPSKTYATIPYLLEMLGDAQNTEEFKRIAMNLQKYNELSVIEPIIKKFKELGLEKERDRSYLENHLLLDYLPHTKEEDKLLVLNLIYDTSHQVDGNVFTPPHFDKAINTLKDYISSPNKEIQIVVLRTYEKIINSAKSTSIESAHKEGMSKLDDMRQILLKNKNKVKEPEITRQIDYLLNEIEQLKKAQN